MYLLQSWRESLVFFKPSNFKTFLLESLKIGLVGFKYWLKYCLIFFLAYVVIDWCYRIQFVPSYKISKFFIRFLFGCVFSFFTILSIRFSFEKKGLSSFWSYWYYFIFIFIVNALRFLIDFIYMFTFTYIYALLSGQVFLFPCLKFVGFIAKLSLFFLSRFPVYFIWDEINLLRVVSLLIFPFFLFFEFFVLDSEVKIKKISRSFYKSLKMLLFNFPFCFIISIFIYVTAVLMSYIIIYTLVFIILKLIGLFFTFSITGDVYAFAWHAFAFYIHILLNVFACAIFYNFYKKRLETLEI